jgi:ABC-type multidrug transport system permease subunit
MTTTIPLAEAVTFTYVYSNRAPAWAMWAAVTAVAVIAALMILFLRRGRR